MVRYHSLVLDVDSTLAGLEGIDWLARQRDAAVAARIAELTDQAMDGRLPLDAVYGARLEAIRPTRVEIETLAGEYVAHVAPGALGVLADIRAAGISVALVSGGVRDAIIPLAEQLGLDAAAVHAVELTFDGSGRYAGFEPSPLATQHGKATVVKALLAERVLARPLLAVGDGATDVEMREVADAFAAFVGFVSRPAVVERADYVVASFEDLRALVL